MRSFSILSLLVCVLSTASSISAGHARIQAVHNGHRGVKRQPTPVDLSEANQKIPPPEKRQGNGARFSWYRTGLGACGGYNGENDLIVALNQAQWENGAHCNQQISININGHTETATIVDLCPDCPPGALDFSRGLFLKWSDSPENQGLMHGDWWFGGGQPQQPQQPTTTHQEPTSTEAPPPPPPTTTSTTPPPPPPTTTSTSSEPTSTSTSSTPTSTSTSTESSTTATSESSSSAPSSSSTPTQPAPTGVISNAEQVFVGLGAFISAGLSITN